MSWSALPAPPWYDFYFILGHVSHTSIPWIWLFFLIPLWFCFCSTYQLKCPPNWATPTHISKLISNGIVWGSPHLLPLVLLLTLSLSALPHGLMCEVFFITLACNWDWSIGGTKRRLESGGKRSLGIFSFHFHTLSSPLDCGLAVALLLQTMPQLPDYSSHSHWKQAFPSLPAHTC